MANCSQLVVMVLASVMGTSCSQVNETFQNKPALMNFAVMHPLAAVSIGKNDDSQNITSSAVRLSTRLGLDNSKNGDGRGTQVNAVRHSLWQAAITARFGEKIATQAGNAYEYDATFKETHDYPNRYAADEAVDLRNNAIGRAIGAQSPQDTMQQLTEKLLNHFGQHGMWTAEAIQENGQTVWRIKKEKLPEKTHQAALQKLKLLNQYGFTQEEVQKQTQKSQK